jgi:hypothetical protein
MDRETGKMLSLSSLSGSSMSLKLLLPRRSGNKNMKENGREEKKQRN